MPKRILSLFRNLFHERAIEREMDDELRSSVELLTQEKMKEGLSQSAARREALIELGGVEQVKEEVRAARAGRFLEDFARDVRFAIRTLAKSPGFTTVAVLTLALGIGGSTAIFSIVDDVLLRPLPFKDASRLVELHEGFPKLHLANMDFTPPDFAFYQREQKSFSVLAEFQNEPLDLTGRGQPERLPAARVSATLFPMLGARPFIGRTFTSKEDTQGHPVVILSYSLWQRQFAGARNVIGQTIDLNRRSYAVIGVMPRNFVFPLPGLKLNNSLKYNNTPADLWVPMAFQPSELQRFNGTYTTSVMGRLRPDVTLAKARAEAALLSRSVLKTYPVFIISTLQGGRLHITLSPLQQEVVGSVRALLLILMGAVSFVLLIACANVATLLLSRTTMRQGEVAIRSALGATRFRLLCQMFSESLVLALAGGALGFLLAIAARSVMLALVPPSIPLPHHVPLNAGVFVFTLAASLLSAVLFGFAPAFQMSLPSVESRLREVGRSLTPGRSRRFTQSFLVSAEFTLSFILLVGGGLLVRSFAKLLAANPGFRPDHVLTLNVPLPSQVYSNGSQVRNFYTELIRRISVLPGVESAAASTDLPLKQGEMVGISYQGEGNPATKAPKATHETWIKGNYFSAMGIPLLQGRLFSTLDHFGSLTVAIVSHSTARQFWPGQNAIGQHVFWAGSAQPITVVGVVGDVGPAASDAATAPHIYCPYDQLNATYLMNDPFGDLQAMNIVVRTRENPSLLASDIVAQAHSLDPDLAVANLRTMTQVVHSTVAGPRFDAFLLGSFSGLGLLLAAIGIYGVIAYTTSQRTHEMGIRMALGAGRMEILQLILGKGMRLALIGICAGVVGAIFLTRLMRSLLYGVATTDPGTFVGVAIVLTIVAAFACYIPARRATKVDPMVALRYE